MPASGRCSAGRRRSSTRTCRCRRRCRSPSRCATRCESAQKGEVPDLAQAVRRRGRPDERRRPPRARLARHHAGVGADPRIPVVVRALGAVRPARADSGAPAATEAGVKTPRRPARPGGRAPRRRALARGDPLRQAEARRPVHVEARVRGRRHRRRGAAVRAQRPERRRLQAAHDAARSSSSRSSPPPGRSACAGTARRSTTRSSAGFQQAFDDTKQRGVAGFIIGHILEVVLGAPLDYFLDRSD